jgi:hypothetical protein
VQDVDFSVPPVEHAEGDRVGGAPALLIALPVPVHRAIGVQDRDEVVCISEVLLQFHMAPCERGARPSAGSRRSRHQAARPHAIGSPAAATRQANRALHMIACTRLAAHAPTRAYRDRRAREQLSPKDILRCLKRYVAREVHKALTRQNVADP